MCVELFEFSDDDRGGRRRDDAYFRDDQRNVLLRSEVVCKGDLIRVTVVSPENRLDTVV